jgi:two-component system sensor histidine kinase RstB
LKALIEELLTYARDRPQNELNLSTPDLPAWLQTHIDDVQSVNPQRTLLTRVTPGDYGALDMRLMERVLDNLMNNAMRYSESTLQIGLDLQGNQASLTVEDDGPGIAPEARETVFEPFVRLDPSRDRATGGCGLGLAIVTLSRRRWAARCIAKRASSAARASALAGRCTITSPFPSLPDFNRTLA